MSALTGHRRTIGAPYRCVGCFQKRCSGMTAECQRGWFVCRDYPWPVAWPDSEGERFVYAIRDTLAGLVKIGVSNRPYVRLTQIQHEHGSWLQMAAITAGTRDREQRLHTQFRNARQLGEWFVEVPEITEWINEHQRLAVKAEEYVVINAS